MFIEIQREFGERRNYREILKRIRETILIANSGYFSTENLHYLFINKINSLIGFVSSITANLDDDFTIEDGLTISEGWDAFVEPVLDMIDNN